MHLAHTAPCRLYVREKKQKGSGIAYNTRCPRWDQDFQFLVHFPRTPGADRRPVRLRPLPQSGLRRQVRYEELLLRVSERWEIRSRGLVGRDEIA